MGLKYGLINFDSLISYKQKGVSLSPSKKPVQLLAKGFNCLSELSKGGLFHFFAY